MRGIMPEYTEGICEDGAAILKDGKMMRIDEILSELKMEGKELRVRASFSDDKTLIWTSHATLKDIMKVDGRSLSFTQEGITVTIDIV